MCPSFLEPHKLVPHSSLVLVRYSRVYLINKKIRPRSMREITYKDDIIMKYEGRRDSRGPPSILVNMVKNSFTRKEAKLRIRDTKYLPS